MRLYTISHNTLDYGPLYVVRIHVVSALGLVALSPPHAVEETLDAARASVPDGCVNLGREADDDPVIVETWF